MLAALNIQNCDFSREVSAETLSRLNSLGTIKRYSTGENIFNQYDDGTSFHILLDGIVSITALRESGQSTIIDTVHKGHLFGLNSAILHRPYLVSAVADTDVVTLAIPFTNAQQMLTEHPELSLPMLRELATQTRILTNQIRQLKLQKGNERVAHYILSLSPSMTGSFVCDLNEPRRVIAQRLGMTPESLSRSIAALKAKGVIFERTSVRVKDAALLRSYCGLEVIQ